FLISQIYLAITAPRCEERAAIEYERSEYIGQLSTGFLKFSLFIYFLIFLNVFSSLLALAMTAFAKTNYEGLMHNYEGLMREL
ncbi:hypothetical protein, partial [Acinetobacter towneri]|uniref:hypothetical protein n=1 Tax=Acinetobacter towneri TaxID=202956 RepID=UPI001BB2E580